MHTTGDDQKRYAYAVIARNVRRIAAIVSGSRVEDQLRQQLLAALEQLHHQAWLVLYDWDTGEMLEGEDTYSDGSQVTTTLDWGKGPRRWYAVPSRASRSTRDRATSRTNCGWTTRRPALHDN